MRVPLDRQAIEKRDFPIGRRGYDTAAVDAHLARLADEMEALERQRERRSVDSLAQTASERVRAIVEAAEASAAVIESSAEDEAQQVRAEAERTRAEALQRAGDHVRRVAEASGEMLRRVEAMQEELGRLADALHTGAAQANADLTLQESNMRELRTAAGERPVEAAPASAPEHRSEADLPRTAEVEQFDRSEPEPEPEPELEPDRADDVEGARLIALNMALNGQGREEADRYLAENFELPDRGQLLEEVYATIETGR